MASSFLFKWSHPASEVYVTGTFDDWGKSVKLERKGEGFEKLVELPQPEEKVLYKFVVDGNNWTVDPTAPQETDDSNNVNNVLTPDKLIKPTSTSSDMSDPSSNMISGVTPQSTTAALAGQVPKESERGQEANTGDTSSRISDPSSNMISGVTPQSTTAALAGQVPKESERSQEINTGDTSSKMSDPSSNMLSGVTPQSTTAALAGQVPKESERGQEANRGSSDLPGSFPETPAPNEMSEFGVKPIPASEGTGNPVHLEPGEKVPDPTTINQNTISSTARDDPFLVEAAEKAAGEPDRKNDPPADKAVEKAEGESAFGVSPLPATSGIGNPEKAEGESVFGVSPLPATSGIGNPEKAEGESVFGVSPLPATSGIGNPIQLQPGEKVPDPSTFTNNTIQSNVQLDRESYEKGQEIPQLPNVVTPPNERQGDMFSVPGISGTMIPESSLPMGGGSSSEQDITPFTQSAGAGSTTAALAAKVPMEPRGVPEVVEESQQEAGLEPEASGNREAVADKTAMEKELESKVPEEPATSEGTAGSGIGAGSGNATSIPSHGLPPSIQQSIDDMNKGTTIAPTVPDIVQESIAESHQSPEAAASKGMVQEKANVEAELLKGQTPDESVGEPAPSTSAALAESAPAATASSIKPDTTAPAPTAEDTSALPTTTVTEPANAATPSMPDTDPRSVPTTDPTVTSAEPPASTSKETPALTPAVGNAKHRDVSRSVSPMTRTDQTSQTQPSVTSGVGESSAPTQSGPAAAATAAATSSKPATSPATSSSTDKKSKRASGFFGKLKSKFSDKDKK